MPFFKTTKDILTTPWEDELWDDNWMDSDKLKLPPTYQWNYSRELQIEDIEIWEVLYQATGGVGVYAAWLPYAEYYMITTGWEMAKIGMGIETYYGKGAQQKVAQKMQEMGIPFATYKVWVNNEDMWLYTNE